jgi:poly(beta-D-mannuronate) lyase
MRNDRRIGNRRAWWLVAGVSLLGADACSARVTPAAHPGPSAPAAATSVVTTAPPPATTPPAALRSPFDVESRRARIGHPLPPPPDPPATPPIRDVTGVSFYVDDAKSVADPDLRAQNLAALAPLRRFVADVIALTDGWMVSRPADPRYAQRAAGALSAWAVAGALLGQVNQQGAYEREWTLGSLSLAYLKIRDAPFIPAPHHAAIQRWLCAIATAVRPPYERMTKKSSSNNHAYWTGLAVAAAGIACQDRGHFDWGLARARIGIGQIRDDGLLPLELERERLALHYHVFALSPLVLLAELAVANGVPLYDERDHALRRLAERVIAGLADPRAFEQLTGFAQEQLTDPPQKADLAWAEPYAARFPDARLAAWLEQARPLRDVRLGGDLTAAFR